MTPEIIYEDTDIIVCYKPAGIAAETNRIGQQDMVSLLKNYRASKGEQPYIGLVHRLDQPVEGLLVFGKNQQAASELSRQVQQHSIGKYYYAVGMREDAENTLPASGTVTLTDYILFDRKKNVSSIVAEHTPQAKKAVLDYRVLAWDEQRVCFDITLHTGRHHQIRLQMANCGFPLVGDMKYGNQKDMSVSQLALCSYRLKFRHPATGRMLDFSIRPHNLVFKTFL